MYKAKESRDPYLLGEVDKQNRGTIQYGLIFNSLTVFAFVFACELNGKNSSTVKMTWLQKLKLSCGRVDHYIIDNHSIIKEEHIQ